MPFFVVRTVGGREDLVAEFLAEEAKRRKAKIYAVLVPPGIKGYIFVEADNIYEVQRAVYGIPHAKGVLPKEVPFEEIEKYLVPEKKKIEIHRGDIVEIIAGPFKGYKGRVIRVDEQKEEVTVELMESMIPIPVTVKIEDVKVVKKEAEVAKELEEKTKRLEKEVEEEWLKF